MHFKLNLILFFLNSVTSRASHHHESLIRNRRLPDSEPMIMPNLEPEIAEHCRNQSICEDVPNYPHEYIDYLLQRNATVRNTLLYMMGGMVLPEGCKDSKEPIHDELCPSIIKRMEARAGRGTNGRWHFLVGGRSHCIEVCVDPESPCKRHGIVVITGYKATCRQKMIKTNMAALDENGVVKPMYLPIQNGCCCHVTQDISSLWNT